MIQCFADIAGRDGLNGMLTVIQIEKYVFYLNKWGQGGEEYLTNKYSAELPPDFSIKITNPGGIVIMGKDANLTNAQKHDFEVI